MRRYFAALWYSNRFPSAANCARRAHSQSFVGHTGSPGKPRCIKSVLKQYGNVESFASKLRGQPLPAPHSRGADRDSHRSECDSHSLAPGKDRRPMAVRSSTISSSGRVCRIAASAGRAITASPTQLVVRTRIFIPSGPAGCGEYRLGPRSIIHPHRKRPCESGKHKSGVLFAPNRAD